MERWVKDTEDLRNVYSELRSLEALSLSLPKEHSQKFLKDIQEAQSLVLQCCLSYLRYGLDTESKPSSVETGKK